MRRALDQMVERLLAERAMRVGRSSTLNDWLRGHGWTFKKSPHMHWSRSVPTS
ncbi:transposase [Aquibium oceanicum]|uniref:Transposase n=1 Tax=Aquibium oceanicum TaxID=1670800 RepID=A0A1L3SRH5_9HYPH|nr:transposase [Aquibium oceanicum]